EEHHLGRDEEQHAVAQTEPDDWRVQARRTALAHHVAPPEEHRAEYHDDTGDQCDVVAEMGSEDDAENSQQAADRANDRPRAWIHEMVRLVQAGILERGFAVRVRVVAHAELIPVLWRIIANSFVCSGGLPRQRTDMLPRLRKRTGLGRV